MMGLAGLVAAADPDQAREDPRSLPGPPKECNITAFWVLGYLPGPPKVLSMKHNSFAGYSERLWGIVLHAFGVQVHKTTIPDTESPHPLYFPEVQVVQVAQLLKNLLPKAMIHMGLKR